MFRPPFVTQLPLLHTDTVFQLADERPRPIALGPTSCYSGLLNEKYIFSHSTVHFLLPVGGGYLMSSVDEMSDPDHILHVFIHSIR